MVQGLAFLSKKSWHVKNIANQEKVWVAEQREEQEKAKAKELAKEIQQEREQEELDRIAGKSATVDRGIDWMYHGQSKESEIAKQDAEKKSEEYLLGKEFAPDTAVKGDIAAAAEETQGVNAVVEAGGAFVSKEAEDSKMPAWSEPSVAEKNEAFRVRHEDPMFAVTHREMQKRQELEKRKELYEKVTGQSIVAIPKGQFPDSDDSDPEKNKSRSRKHKKKHKKEKKAHKKDRKVRKRERRERRRQYSDSEGDEYESDYRSDEEFRSHRHREPRDRYHHDRDRDADRERQGSLKRYDDGYTHRRSRQNDDDDFGRVSRKYRDDGEEARHYHRDEFGREYPRNRRSENHEHKRRRRSYDDDRDYDQRSSSFHRKPPPASNTQQNDPKPPPTSHTQHNDRKPPPSRSHHEPSVHELPKKQSGYGLQGVSSVSGDNRADLGPDRAQLQRKREARQAEKQKHRERSFKRSTLSAEERAEKLREMEQHAAKRFQGIEAESGETKEGDNSTPQQGQASFVRDITRQVHGVSGGDSESLSSRIAQNSTNNQRRHESFL
mmetsp:Transcript_12921/g.35760  ORF Transcript_12921/g.35760 Transcript_12921/m.35760 type:complete len:551 (+) Transcript_12921:63-1715(+)